MPASLNEHVLQLKVLDARFGAECLRFVAEKHARAKVGEEARQTLRVSGF